MSEFRRLVRLTASAAVREKRLGELMAGRGESDLAAASRAVEDAQVRGSLELAGLRADDEEAGQALRRAHRALDPQAPLSAQAVLSWHRALVGHDRIRSSERTRPDGPAPAPVAFITSRLEIVEHWLQVDSGRELKPAQQAALVYARLLEIVPFEEANGRVARLAASHLMVRAGGRPPILMGSDAPRLESALAAAFALHTEPLSQAFEEASEHALDVMIAALERG